MEMRIPNLMELRQQMRDAIGPEGGAEAAEEGAEHRFEAFQGATIRMMDADGSVEMKETNGAREVKVTDHDGQTVWSGPWDTEQDKAAAPQDVRERIDRLNIGDFRGGLKLQLGPR